VKIAKIAVNVFEHPTRLVRDSHGHAHASRDAPGKARLAMLRVVTEDGTEGYAFGSPEVIRGSAIDEDFGNSLPSEGIALQFCDFR